MALALLLPLTLLTPSLQQAPVWSAVEPLANGTSWDSALGLAVAGPNDVWELVRQGSGFNGQGRVVRRWNANGALLSSFDLGLSAPAGERLEHIEADGLGGAVLAGEILGTTPLGIAPGFGGQDVLVTRCDASGAVSWALRIGGSGLDELEDLVADGLGGAWIVGNTRSPDGFGGPQVRSVDPFVAHITPSGALGFIARVSPFDFITLHGIALDDLGRPVVTGFFDDGTGPNYGSVVYALDATGTIRWTSSSPGEVRKINDIDIDPAGSIYVAGSVDPLANRAAMAKLDPAGSLLFGQLLGSLGGEAIAVAISPSGAVHVSVENGFPSRSRVSSFDDSGNLQRTTDIEFTGRLRSPAYGIASDGNGSLFVAGGAFAAVGLDLDPWIGRIAIEDTSMMGCPGATNSTGMIATAAAVGEASTSNSSLTLYVDHLPATTFGYFLLSQTIGNSVNPGGANGTLCLGGQIGRMNRLGEILQADASGRAHLPFDPTNVPQPNGTSSVTPGDLWYFQLWYRDGAGSAFSSSFQVTF